MGHRQQGKGSRNFKAIWRDKQLNLDWMAGKRLLRGRYKTLSIWRKEGKGTESKTKSSCWRKNLQETLISKRKYYTAPILPLLQKTEADNNFVLLQEQIRLGAVSRQLCMSGDTLHFTTSFLTSLLCPQLRLCSFTWKSTNVKNNGWFWSSWTRNTTVITILKEY